MNQLQHETSPYLLQHAHNPVNWHAWKPDALEKARREDKPILVSIGYSTCHWCHVMERESFEDEEVAEFMNEHFICIKVDREERPDVDQIYMEACQLIGGGCGWPLNCFLTPEGRPFYVGTYFPPIPAYNRPSWLQVLMSVSHAFQNKRNEIEEQAKRVTEHIRNGSGNLVGSRLTVIGAPSPFTPPLFERIYFNLKRGFDRENGGFGGAPKFPGTMALHFLLNHHFFSGEKEALQHALLTLNKMAMGGIYDHLGGGFARYTVDAKWLVPHFEKMLYDNALLVSLLAEAVKFCAAKLQFGGGGDSAKLEFGGTFQETIEETLEWVRREMTSEEGGFYSAQDADSEGVEGKFYVWEKAEVEATLGEEARLFCEFYDVTEHGNWEEKNILWRRLSFEDFAEKRGLHLAEFRSKMAAARRKLFEVRDRRVHPGLDDKILLDWNALMISAHAKAFQALGNSVHKLTAVRCLEFLLEKMTQPDGVTLFHTYKNGKAQYDAFLDDYAFLVEAMLDVYEITFDTAWLLRADRYVAFILENFLDADEKLFFFTSSKQKDILLRRKDLYDSATPSGNSTMVRNLQRLGILLDKPDYRELASEMLLTLKDAVERYPSSFSRWATSMMDEGHGIPEIAVVGERAHELADEVNRQFLPQKVMMAAKVGKEQFPLLAGKDGGGDTLIYVCQNYACRQPVKTVEAFRELLDG